MCSLGINASPFFSDEIVEVVVRVLQVFQGGRVSIYEHTARPANGIGHRAQQVRLYMHRFFLVEHNQEIDIRIGLVIPSRSRSKKPNASKPLPKHPLVARNGFPDRNPYRFFGGRAVGNDLVSGAVNR